MATLPQLFPDLNDITTATKTVVTLYGRKTNGELIAIQVDDNGVVATSGGGGGGGGGGISASTNSYFADQTGGALNGSFATVNKVFGFTSVSVSIYNDDSTEVIEFSFDGTNIHGRLKVGEALAMDYRAQTHVHLRTVSGNPAQYRVMAY